MCADQDTSCSPSPGLRAQLGRFLQGLFPYRLLQLLGAAWDYVLGLGGRGLLFLLPPGWVVHKQVGPGELPEVFEALRELGSWDELEDCLEELGPWKELVSPEQGMDILSSLQGFVSSKEQGLWEPELDCWDKNMAPSKEQELWKPGLDTWKELLVTNQKGGHCAWKRTMSPGCHMEEPQGETCSHLRFPGFSMVSCILSPGTGGVITWVAPGNEPPDKDASEDITPEPESHCEIEHIRNKRLCFLQQNQVQEVTIPDRQLGHQEEVQDLLDLYDPLWIPCEQQLTPDQGLLTSEWQQEPEIPHKSQLLDTFQNHDLELPVQKPQLLAPAQSVDYTDSICHKDLPSPDQDQGYCSLEDCHSLNLTGDFTPSFESLAGTTHVICFQVELADSSPVRGELQNIDQFGKEESKLIDRDSGEEDSDLEDDIPVTARPVCTNKYISYILGGTTSDEERSSCSEDEDWDNDDGIDSERSVSDSETQEPEALEILNCFNSTDPYHPQNFTAILHTGVRTEETPLPLGGEGEAPSDDSSWWDSDTGSESESGDESGVDEEENLKLWNSFNKSNDPYNPLCFKAPVSSSERKKQSRDTLSKHTESVCDTTSLSCSLNIKEAHARKKVTFSDKVTEYMCAEEDRRGPWEEYARDRCRFQRRIGEIEAAIGHCLAPKHRQRVWDSMQTQWGS